MKKIVVVDIDGTLSIPSPLRAHLIPHRYLRDEPGAWDEYNLAAHMDEPSANVVAVVRALSEEFTIVVLTARSEIAMDVTVGWLQKHSIPFDELLMRSSSDCRRSGEFKLTALNGVGLERIVCCLEDDASIAAEMRNAGLTVLNV